MSFDALIKHANFLDERGFSLAANAIDMAIKDHPDSYLGALKKLAAFALMLDIEGHRVTADVIDAYLALEPSLKKEARLADEDHLYDREKHREESLFTKLEKEQRKAVEPEFDSWKGGAHTLLTRYSPDYPGVMMLRVSDGVYQDMLSKRVYDFRQGFITEEGKVYTGGSGALQTSNVENMIKSPLLMDSKGLTSRM